MGLKYRRHLGGMADALDLKPSAEKRVGSTPTDDTDGGRPLNYVRGGRGETLMQRRIAPSPANLGG